MRNFILLISVIMVSSCAHHGLYYAPDKISTRYGWKGGAAHAVTQQNRDGRGDKRFREPGFNFPTLWNSEPRTLVKDGFDVANTQTDINRMITSGQVFSAKRGDVSISSAEKYANRKSVDEQLDKIISSRQEFEKNVIRDAKKILSLDKKVSRSKNKNSESARLLQGLKHEMDVRYNTMCALRLIYLEGVYNAVYKGLHSDVSKSCPNFVFDTDNPSYAYQVTNFSSSIVNYIKNNRKDIIALSPMIWPCNALTDGKDHDPQDYRLEYLYGDPSKVDDPKIREIIFGMQENYYVSGCKKINQFIAEDESRKDVLKKYHIFDAESKWYMVTMGDSKVYVEICGDKNYMKICSLINPSRGICIVRS